MSVHQHFTIIIIFFTLLLISCTSTGKVESQLSSAPSSSSVFQPDRPIPYPIDIPDSFEIAILNGTRSDDGSPGQNYWQNYASYSLHAEIDPESHTLFGKASIIYQNNSPDDLDIIVFELAQNLHKAGTPKMDVTEITGGKQLNRVAVNGTQLEETTMRARWIQGGGGYIVEGTQLYILPDEILESGGEMEFEFDWTFQIPRQGASGRMGRSRDNLFFIAYWYPHLSVYDDVHGWFYDSFLGNAEFYHGFADYELTVTMPREWLVMGTGEFLNPEETLSPQTLEQYLLSGQSDTSIVIADFDELEEATNYSDNGKLTWKFRAEKVRDVAFSATLESRWEGARTPVGDLTGNGETDYTRINTFFRETAPLWFRQTEYAQHSITFLSDYMKYPYPWPHMTSVEGADIIGGGMEFPMMTVIGDYNNVGAVRLYGVTAHELAHMWFPMIISTNERRYTWIDEGYTTFHTNKANIDYFGEERFNELDVFIGYLQIAGTELEGEIMRWSDFHYPGMAYGVASYPKPASVLYALRFVLGEELFREAHHEFINRWAYKHPYPWDIFHTFEDISGMDLSWFWRSWYYETWVLDQSVAGVYEDGSRTVIVIEDLGEVPMPVKLEITFDDNTTQLKTLDVDYWLNGHRTREVVLETDKTVIRVQIDPDRKLPDADYSNNTWIR
ncbi:MAG: M1 family peptidase [Balneolaceae bacterium]|nr:MAG: M1 family peptidase [Balneolaceae bacterium]